MRLFNPFAGIAFACLMLTLGGCATLPQAISAIGTAESAIGFAKTAWSKSGVTLFDVEATYGIIQSATVNFQKAECPRASSHSWCPAFHTQAAKTDKAVRDQFKKGEDFIAANPTLSTGGVIAAAEGAVNAAASVADSFGVKL